MCLSVPARVVAVDGCGPLPTARLDVGGRPATCCLAYLPDVAVGEYVLVSGGFAVERLDPEAAAASLAAFAALGLLPGEG